MLVGEASGANKAGGRPEGIFPFVATVGVWQRLTTPASALCSGVVEARVAAVVGRSLMVRAKADPLGVGIAQSVKRSIAHLKV